MLTKSSGCTFDYLGAEDFDAAQYVRAGVAWNASSTEAATLPPRFRC